MARRLIAIMLVLAMIFACSTTVFAGTSSAPDVMIDGKYVTFTDAAPQNINGRVMVPFRAILEALGADVVYDNATKTVTATLGETEISFLPSKSDLTVITSGETSTTKMDVVPFLDPNTGRTYVSAKYVAEAFGYAVGWDSSEKTVVIIDFGTLFANASEDFSILELMMTSETDMEQAYKTSGTMEYDLTMYAYGTEDSSMGFDASYTGLQKGMDVDMDMAISVDVQALVNQVDTTLDTELTKMLGILSDMKIQVKLNGETGDMYIKGDALNMLFGETKTGTWYKMNLYETYESIGIDLQGLMGTLTANNSMTLEGLLTLMANMYSSVLTTETYDEVVATYDLAKALIGDAAFKTSTSGNVTTYTAKIDSASILKAIATYSDMAQIKSALQGFKTLEGSITIKASNNTLNSYELTFGAKDADMDVSGTMTGNLTDAKLTMTMDMVNVMKLKMSVTSNVTETNQTVNVSIPAGATVVNISEL